MAYRSKISFFTVTGFIHTLQRLIHARQGLFCLIAGRVVSCGTLQYTGTELAVSIGTDD